MWVIIAQVLTCLSHKGAVLAESHIPQLDACRQLHFPLDIETAVRGRRDSANADPNADDFDTAFVDHNPVSRLVERIDGYGWRCSVIHCELSSQFRGIRFIKVCHE